MCQLVGIALGVLKSDREGVVVAGIGFEWASRFCASVSICSAAESRMRKSDEEKEVAPCCREELPDIEGFVVVW